MAFNYAALQKLATKLIRQFGQPAALREEGVSADIDCKVVEVTNDPRARDGQLLQDGDKRFLLAADATVVPNPEIHSLVVDGDIWRIVSAPPLKPAGTKIYYNVLARL